jgi:tyrosinase
LPPDQAAAAVDKANKENPVSAIDFSSVTNTAVTDRCSNPRVRTEWRLLSSSQKSSFVNAIKCLMNRPSAGGFPASRSRYEDLVSVHQQMAGTVHMTGVFLPWHRYYVHIFEDMLRAECGYNSPVPWWDETKDAGHFGSSPIFAADWFGWGPAKKSNGAATCMVSTGVFKGTTCHIGPGSSNTNHCLSRALDESLTAQCNKGYENTCYGSGRYRDFETCVEYGPHAYGHNGIGGVMSDVATSCGDPVFFMHHGYVDHMWRLWQNKGYPGRLSDISSALNPDGSGTVTLNTVLSSRGLRPSVRVSDVMNTEGPYLCYKYNV